MMFNFKRLHKLAELPVRANPSDSGVDIRACCENWITIHPGEFKSIPTGWAVQVPVGFEVQVRPRSGLAAKYGVTVLNAPGTIDCSYRGEIFVILINHGPDVFDVHHGDRIAQLVVADVYLPRPVEVSELSVTHRGTDGLGSTGVK